MALLEITPRVEGYWNQVVRLVSLGEPPEDIPKAHDACLAAKRSALERLKPGETFTAVAEAIGGTLEKHGYSMKGVGSVHTTGLDLSESTMNLDNERKIEPGLLVTVHPMMATGDWRQLFVGESYFLHEDRLERLNHCDEEIAVLGGEPPAPLGGEGPQRETNENNKNNENNEDNEQLILSQEPILGETGKYNGSMRCMRSRAHEKSCQRLCTKPYRIR